jgi:SAM-dependent methyltransferase
MSSPLTAKDAQAYWEERAKAFAWEDDHGWAAVCHRGAPLAYNRFIDWAQRRAFRSMLECSDIRPPAKALDIGCGTGRWTRLLQEAGFQVQGFDVAPSMVARASEITPAIQFVVASATSLPVQDESCDALTCITALHHLPLSEQEDAVAEIARVLRPGGKCLALILVKTLQLFQRQSMDLVQASGEEYLSPAVLLHWFVSGVRAAAHGRSKPSDRSVGAGSGVISFIYRVSLKLAVTMSYVCEGWASRYWSRAPSAAVAFVFEKPS